jgi:tetratricopeptide (TPR) repeat protein
MNHRNILAILAVILICVMGISPALAANATQPQDAATGYYNLAEYALAAGNYSDAIAYYDLALGSNTTIIQESGGLLYTYHDKSYAQIHLGNYSDAIDTLNAGLAIFPTDENLWNNKGYAQYMIGDYKDAVVSYNNALASDTNFTTALINKGDALQKLGNYQDAVTAYKAALASNPGNSAATTKLAAAEKEAAAALPVTLIALVIVVILAGAGVAYYILKKRPADVKNTEEQVNKAGSKKNRKR